MRPTNLNFRSSKERTGEILYPQIKYDGTKMNLLKRSRRYVGESMDIRSSARFTTFSNEKRFNWIQVKGEYLTYFQNSIPQLSVGPGSYNSQVDKTITEQICKSKHKGSVPLMGSPKGKESSYSMVGNSIVLDDTFLSKDRLSQRIKRYNQDLLNLSLQTLPLSSQRDSVELKKATAEGNRYSIGRFQSSQFNQSSAEGEIQKKPKSIRKVRPLTASFRNQQALCKLLPFNIDSKNCSPSNQKTQRDIQVIKEVKKRRTLKSKSSTAQTSKIHTIVNPSQKSTQVSNAHLTMNDTRLSSQELEQLKLPKSGLQSEQLILPQSIDLNPLEEIDQVTIEVPPIIINEHERTSARQEVKIQKVKLKQRKIQKKKQTVLSPYQSLTLEQLQKAFKLKQNTIIIN